MKMNYYVDGEVLVIEGDTAKELLEQIEKAEALKIDAEVKEGVLILE